MGDTRFSTQPCFCPPHPGLVAQHRAGVIGRQGDASEACLFLESTGRIPGLNDGMIFPPSHFRTTPTLHELTTAALERPFLRGPIKLVIVLAEFKDQKFDAGAPAHFEDLFFSTGKIPTGSVTEYYEEVSNGLVSLTGQVFGPFKLNKEASYYACGGYGRQEEAPNLRNLADDALTAAMSSINFDPYDNDGNGFVDGFVVVHSGTGAEQTRDPNDIWSTKWVLPSERAVNDVKVFAFLTIPGDVKIGISAHELGHLLFGWPDLYDDDAEGGTSAGIGNWCLMAGGTWGGGGDKPVHPSAWCKANQGWVDVIDETTNHQITIADVKTGRKVHRLSKDGDTSGKEYFLLENRERTGKDSELPGDGLLIWHIDDSVDNNANEFHPKVGLLQADGLEDLQFKRNFGDAGDPFPGTSNNVSFTATTNPNSKNYAGQDTYVSVTSIPKESGSMTVNITVNAIPSAFESDGKAWYRLSNTQTGYSLDVKNDGMGNREGYIELARDGDVSGQFWQFKPLLDGTYRIRNMFLGSNRALDSHRNNKTKVHLATIGDSSGQHWSVNPWGDGSFHIENAWSGPYLALDSIDGEVNVKMNNGPDSARSTQRWTIVKIREITEPDFLT